MDIIAAIAEELQIKKGQAEAAVKLIDEGNTIPFIARYRKEATGSLNDEVLRNLFDRLTYLRNLEDKKQTVLQALRSRASLRMSLRRQSLRHRHRWRLTICTDLTVRREEPVPQSQRKRA